MTATEPVVLSETRATVVQIAAKVTGTTATKTAQRKVTRWLEKGVNIRGTVVRLEGVRIATKWVTSFEAFNRFMAACSGRPAPAAPDRTPAQQERDSKAASARLKKMLARAGCKPLKEDAK